MSALEQISEAQRQLALVDSPADAKSLYDKLETLSQYARRVRLDTDQQNEIAEAKLLTAHKGGSLLAEVERRQGERTDIVSGSKTPLQRTLADAAMSEKQGERWRRLDQVPEEELVARIRAMRDEGEEVTFAAFLNRAHVANNSGENEWYTPAEYIAAARDVMGGIDLDPASSREANEVVQAQRFFTVDDNGLRQAWSGRVWLNPPYVRPLVDEFCAKLAESYAQGDVSEACVLTNNATETGWFHALAEVAGAICFPRHRVRFWYPGRDSLTPLQGQAVLYLGGSVDAFRSRFVELGFTVAV
jgi:ParB family chromosome partitioning protein